MTPTIGEPVHYVSHGSADGTYPSVCRAAFVTAVDTYQDGTDADGLHIGHVSLCVLNPGGIFFAPTVLQDEAGRRGGTWHWPEHDEPGAAA